MGVPSFRRTRPQRNTTRKTPLLQAVYRFFPAVPRGRTRRLTRALDAPPERPYEGKRAASDATHPPLIDSKVPAPVVLQFLQGQPYFIT